MNHRTKQTGIGIVGWLLIIVLAGGSVTIGTQLVPVYMDNSTVIKVMQSLSEEDNLANLSNTQIFAMMKKRLNVNNVRDFPIQDRIEINRTREGVEMIMDYEVRVELVKNLDLVAAFNETVRLQD